MSAMENMVRTVLKAMDLDVDQVKSEVTSRIVAFENNLATLNATLIAINGRLENIEKNLSALMEYHDLEYQNAKGNSHGNDERGNVPLIEGPKASA